MKTRNGSISLLRKVALAVTVIAVSTIAIPAHAAKFGVRVVDANGVPVAGAAVCVGLQGNYKQFGATFTDGQGQVMVDVPNVPLLVTVSKDRFTGLRTLEPARSFNLVKQVKLREGTPGPRCRAGSALAEGQPSVPSLLVSEIAVLGNVLQPVVQGKPSHYRVSDNSDFTGAKWKRYSANIALASNIASADKVYLQLRQRQGTAKAYIESHSDVMTVRLNYNQAE